MKNVLSRPIQAWMPMLGPSIGFPEVRRDATRAFREWEDESIVWLLPGLKKMERWTERSAPNATPRRVLALPSERLDRIDVLHVGLNGFVYGAVDPSDRFPGGQVDQILTTWMNPTQTSVLIAFMPEIRMFVPVVRDGMIVPESGRYAYEEITPEISPAGGLPMEIDHRGRAVISWPPEGSGLSSVFPDHESLERYGPRIRGELGGLPFAQDAEDRDCLGPHWALMWASPFDRFFSPVLGLDTIIARQRMIDLAKRSVQEPESVLKEALTASVDYVSEATTARWLGEFWPKWMESRQGPSTENPTPLWETFGRTKDEAIEVLGEPIGLRRVWGGIGLLWALLLDRLESERPFKLCARCGRVMQPHDRRTRICGPDDDPECYRGRGADRQRRSRVRRS